MSDDMKWMFRTTQLTVVPDHAPTIFSESATSIYIDDEGAGEFLVVRQESGSIAITPEEWPTIRDAINVMMNEIRD